MAYLGRDEWDYNEYHARRPSPHRAHRSSFYLNPEAGYGAPGLERTRSQGASPRPVINVYNDVYQDTHARTETKIPGAFPTAVPAAPAPPPAAAAAPAYIPAMPAYAPYAQGYPGAYVAPDYDRGRRLDQLADKVNRLDLERSRSRYRSRSRSSTHSPPDFYRYEMEKLEREKQWRHEQERIKAELEVKQLKDDARRKQHDIDEHAERKRILAEYEKKKREEEEREKEREEHYRDKLEREKREQKEKDDALYNKFLLKQKEEKEKKEREEKEEKEKIEQALRKKLIEKGFAGNQIEAIISDEKKKTTTTSTSVTVYNNSTSTPVYAKVHKTYLSTETLKYYDIPYRWDDHDPDYIIILQEMSKHETQILFEHTRALREGRLLLEAPKKEKEYAFFRKRERSKSRNRKSGEWKSFGIFEYKK